MREGRAGRLGRGGLRSPVVWLVCALAVGEARLRAQVTVVGGAALVAPGGDATGQTGIAGTLEGQRGAGLVDAPSPRQSLSGTVLDPSGAVVAGARVRLQRTGGAGSGTSGTNGAIEPQETMTDASGGFHFASVPPGTFQVTISRQGFADRIVGVEVAAGQSYGLPPVTLEIAAAATEVEVVYSQREVAEEQLNAEEKQRILGILPNFGVSYVWHAAPLTPGQKFRLAWRSEIDPVSFLGAAVGAGYEQANNYRAGYGQGAQGFFKRFGATYTDGFDGAMLGGVVLPVLLHQDPRYYYMGKEHGTVRHRVLYAISTVVITRGDNGRWQPNYSNVLGNLSAGAISNLYYPASDRGAGLTVENALLGTAAGAIGSLVQEFLIKHISTGVAKP